MNIHVGASFTESYYPKVAEYCFLESLNDMEGVKKFVILFDVSTDFYSDLVAKFKNIKFVRTERSWYKLQEQLNLVACLQYGEFIDYVPDLKDDDYLFFVDADMTVQRTFDVNERQVILEHPHHTLLQMNLHANETLREELGMLGVGDVARIESKFGDTSKLLCFNAGVIGQSPQRWRKARDFYMANFPEWNKYIAHHASTQWFQSWMYQTQGFFLHKPMSDFVTGIHAHAHLWTSVRDFRIRKDDNGFVVRDTIAGPVPVIFAHSHFNRNGGL
jgi:hypothetical protein